MKGGDSSIWAVAVTIVTALVLLGVSSWKTRKIAKQKAELNETKEQLSKQTEVVKTYKEKQDKASQIEQKATEAEAELQAVTKGVQEGEEAVKKSVSIGNDIVAGFNSSKRL